MHAYMHIHICLHACIMRVCTYYIDILTPKKMSLKTWQVVHKLCHAINKADEKIMVRLWTHISS